MVIATGTVRGGRIELTGDQLPEGAVVMVIAAEGSETFELDASDEVVLAAAIQEAERGDSVSSEELLERLRRG